MLSFESGICISILRFVIMRNGSKFPNFKFPNFLNKFRKPNVVTLRKANELLSFETKGSCKLRVDAGGDD